MNIAGHDIAVCSWSLTPKSTQDLIASVKRLGLAHMQLALWPLVRLDDKVKHQELGILRNSGITFTAGMIGFPGEDYASIATIKKTGGFVPDDEFAVRRAFTKSAGQIARELGMNLLSAHIGFVPPSSDPGYATMLERICLVAGDLGELDVELAMETGQETAPELLQFLN